MVYTLRGDQPEYTVGRTVPQQNNFVDVDLGPMGQRKVSRQHARFYLRNNQWFLEDMNSKGGTYVYNNRLNPRQPEPLEDGMVIYFADIKFRLEVAT
jgi:pSer/pThr/pTyr-binding forkhead associated (FHA) protein